MVQYDDHAVSWFGCGMVSPRTLVEVGTLEDKLRRFTAELEGDFLQVAVRCGGHDPAPGNRASSEGDLVDIRVARERRTAYRPQRRHGVHDARWEAEPRSDEYSEMSTARKNCLPSLDDELREFLLK